MAINDYSRLVVVIMKIGEKIKNLRTEQNMTQKEFAEKTGLSISSVQKYEYGDFIPSDSVIIKIAKAFNISISEFLKNTTEYADTNWYTDIAIDEFLKNRVSLNDEINDKNRVLFDLLEKLGFVIKFNSLNTEVIISNKDLNFNSKYNTFKFIQILNILENDILINLKKYDEILKNND